MNILKKFLLKQKIKKYRDRNSISIPFLFLSVFKEFPDIYAFELNQKDKINVGNISENTLKAIFPDLQYYWRVSSASAVSTSAIDDEEEFDDSYAMLSGNYIESSLNILTRRYICCIYQAQIIIYYKNKELKDVQDEVNKIFEQCELKDRTPQCAKVSLVCSDGRDYFTTTSTIAKTTIDLDVNYNDDFKAEYNNIVEFLNSRNSGIVLLHGNAGTGKTSLIRHLITNVPKEYILIPPGMMNYIASPEFISFILNHKNSIFILEDCEQLLIDRRLNQFNSGISTILNMSDGLLSDVFNLKFICTFNADITAIDESLMRPGRCYSNYEFKLLTKDKVKKLAELNNIMLPEIKEMTLAELFNDKLDVDISNKKEKIKKIGF